jgi:hypothetical protein
MVPRAEVLGSIPQGHAFSSAARNNSPGDMERGAIVQQNGQT